MSVPSTAPSDFDRALDTVAALIQRYGEHAFDMDGREAAQVRQDCERWASQLLASGDGESSGGASKRDFGGLRRFFEEHRRTESAFVRTSLSALRGAIDTFARCVRTTVVDDSTADEAARGEIAALSEALSSNDVARIRMSATALASVVSASIEKRQQRHRAQIATLADQLRKIRGELLQARERATMDGLTQLYNRAAFDEHIARIADLGLLLGTPPTLLMIDVDHFKQLNDSRGHPAGDEALRKVSECLLRTFLRKEDFVARYGGEEFAIVLMDASLADARAMAERLRKTVRSMTIEHRGNSFSVTVSIGVAALVPGELAAAWIERADRALYAAKHEGRDRVLVSELPAVFV
ncbi:MAG TPA: GGDEF domain-containing protein [Polyangiaceae bacterium]|nr:GGDEF domain-containing protein [Polyangiaceae bacterium]